MGKGGKDSLVLRDQETAFLRLIYCFCQGISLAVTARSTGLSVKTVRRHYLALCAAAAPCFQSLARNEYPAAAAGRSRSGTDGTAQLLRAHRRMRAMWSGEIQSVENLTEMNSIRQKREKAHRAYTAQVIAVSVSARYLTDEEKLARHDEITAIPF